MVLQSSKLRLLVGTLKDKASIGKATLLSPTSSQATPHPPDIVVLHATSHRPVPCHPKHIAALLSFGHASRLVASAAVFSLSSRLRSTSDPVVALKCLLAVHHVVRRGAFILHDQVLSILRPSALGGRNPLNLSAFRSSSSSLSASAFIRWYARVIELLLASFHILGDFPGRCGKLLEEMVVTRTHGELVRELEVLVEIAEEISRAPEVSREGLVGDVLWMVEEEESAIWEEVVVRVREIGDRVAEMEFGEAVVMGCLFRRIVACCGPLDRYRKMVEEVRDRVERRGVEVGKEVRRGEKVGESERGRWGGVGLTDWEEVRFGSARWAAP